MRTFFERLEPRYALAPTIMVPLDGFVLQDVVDGPGEPATLQTGPTYGRGDVHASGVLGYAPDIGYRGQDSMVIDRADGGTETVTLVVGNRPPVAVDDTLTTSVNTPVVQAAPGVLANDTDADGDPLRASVLSEPANGVAMIYPDGSLVYAPVPDWAGSDSFVYEAADPWGQTAVGTVNVTVGLRLSVTREFVIHNYGDGDLHLTGNPLVQIIGEDAGDFKVIQAPAALIAPGESTTVSIRFTPTAVGVRDATVTIPNNDGDEAFYSFAIQGTGRLVQSSPDYAAEIDAVMGGWPFEGLDLESSLLPELLPDIEPELVQR